MSQFGSFNLFHIFMVVQSN